jgi:hypothetical protein
MSAGMVYPQFHVKHDNDFISLVHKMGTIMPTWHWQSKCGFLTDNKGKYKFIGLEGITDNPATASIESPGDLFKYAPNDQQENVPQELIEPRMDKDPNQATIVLHDEPVDPPATTRSGRLTGPPLHLQDFIVYKSIAYKSIEDMGTIVPDIDSMSPVAFGATSVLYYHEAMAAPDHARFQDAMESEIQGKKKW